ncbi:hypothetical protein HDU76_003467 [Blyttiomyces sp. JEL0837]|nr:hypothetical protein HDU76_003467 [Blyttiomyces sp. JEL0837]
MEDPARDLPEVIRNLINPDVDIVNRTVREVYAHDAVLNHPLFVAKGHKQIGLVYEAWSRAHSGLTPEIKSLLWDPDQRKATIELDQIMTSKYWLGKQRRLNLVVYLTLSTEGSTSSIRASQHESSTTVRRSPDRSTARKRWVIIHQDDFFNPYRFAVGIFAVNGLVRGLIENASWGLQLVGMSLIGVSAVFCRGLDLYLWNPLQQ